jgi:uncharacterized LabA/DUF88 family protein
MSEQQALPAKRCIVYIDGFNLYYGCLKATPYKWLNIEALFKRMRQAETIVRINYFTALVSGANLVRQQTYLRALATLSTVGVHLGLFKPRTRQCGVGACGHPMREYQAPEEKRTDVNIAVQMLDDAYQGACEVMVLVTSDSDQVPVVQMIRRRFPHIKVVVYLPGAYASRAYASELRLAAHAAKGLPEAVLRVSQFPGEVSDGAGGTIQKPATW